MLGLFVELLGGSNSLAISVYLAPDTQTAKTKAINAAATAALENRPDDLLLLIALLDIAKTNEKHRNKLAHWIWGDSADLPDALLLADFTALRESFDRSHTYVYRAVDITNIIQANDRLCGYGLS